MCGIAGGFGRPSGAGVNAMLDLLAHRGPDGRGVYGDPAGRCIIGHNRLAIIDPAGGQQPLTDETGGIWVACNGEIYNFRDLRRELSARGHRFRTASDTEVLAHLYEEEGPAMVARLDGMFALALWDGERLLLARDPLGIKPLYSGRAGDGTLYFASEIKALTGVCERVEEFPPGTWFASDTGFRRYYDLPAFRAGSPAPGRRKPDGRELSPVVMSLRDRLERAVAKRLMADVPVGVFLSGGLDSSLIAAIARKHTDGPLHSFAAGAPGSADLDHARRVAAFLGTVHHEATFTQRDLADRLPEVIYHLESFDAALVRSAVPTYLVSRLASRYVKVVLSGEGADELFAGYDSLKPLAGADLNEEMRRLTGSLHNTNLQRVDRMTMAHSLEGRVPFLDVGMVETAAGIPPAWKVRRTGKGGRAGEKWLLRLAAETYLPPDIVWRNKVKFSHGTGASALLADLAEELAPAVHPGVELRGREETMYYLIFANLFPVAATMATIGRTRSVVPGELSGAMGERR